MLKTKLPIRKSYLRENAYEDAIHANSYRPNTSLEYIARFTTIDASRTITNATFETADTTTFIAQNIVEAAKQAEKYANEYDLVVLDIALNNKFIA